MRRYLGLLGIVLVLFGTQAALARQRHSVHLGKSMHVKLFVGPGNNDTADVIVRPLLVDGEIREFTVGEPRDVTDETFVVQQAYRLNDALPEDTKQVSKWKWKWQKGTWLFVDRSSGRVTRLKLPLFDPFYSSAAWYQDYVAYCGMSSDAEMVYAVVFKLGDKQALLDRELRRARGGQQPDSECAAPRWQRDPMRVTFLAAGLQPMAFEVKGRMVDAYMPPPAEPPAPAPSNGGEQPR